MLMVIVIMMTVPMMTITDDHDDVEDDDDDAQFSFLLSVLSLPLFRFTCKLSEQILWLEMPFNGSRADQTAFIH